MRAAGYSDGSWDLLVQTYPSPMPDGDGIRYSQSGYDRQFVGGCGFWDADADWANSTALPAINKTVKKAAKKAVKKAADDGVAVVGICNGFQILTETGLLPGALMRNAGLDFVCRDVKLEVVTTNTAFTRGYQPGESITVPVAHHDGNFQADADTLDRLEQQGQVAFRYGEQVNGSARDIAGILNEKGNVLGMMPHPERVVEPAHGCTDGRRLFEGLLTVLA